MTKQNGRILGISVFWKNDKPGGIGFTQTFPEGDAGTKFEQLAQRTMQDYDAAQAEGEDVVGASVEQLTRWAQQDVSQLPVPEQFLILCNVMWLETRGHIASDNFNGVQWARLYEGSETCVLVV